MRKFVLLFITMLLLLTGCSANDNTKSNKKQEEKKTEQTAKPQEQEQPKEQIAPPTPTEPELTEHEQAYLEMLQNATESYRQIMVRVLDFISEYTNDNSVALDQNWKKQFVDTANELSNLSGTLTQAEQENLVPEKFSDLHTRTKEALSRTLDGRIYLISGINQRNNKIISNGLQLFNEITEEIRAVNNELGKYGYRNPNLP